MNFRNFHEFDVRLGLSGVIVGENSVGKSNLIFGLRLILDPTLSDTARMLREEDFWDGLSQPVVNREIIEIAIEFEDFEKETPVLAVLQPFCIRPGVARLTYRFKPKPYLNKDAAPSVDDYEFVVFGGVDEKNRVDYSLRRWMPVQLLPALRNAENDLASWRNSPLRPLIERLKLSDDTLSQVASEIDDATGQLLGESDVRQLTGDIQTRLSEMVGNVLEIDPTLGFVPAVPTRLSRALRMFGDGSSQRPVAELSLGVANILYLLLLAIDLERKEAASDRAMTILAIEEPEAHLHTHLQRLVFRDFLRRDAPVILTTHSPHVASVAPIESIVLLKNDPNGDGTKGGSTLEAGLSDREVDDLQRYLDATRAEVLFARGVILVERASELFLVPAVAEGIGKNLDEYGITVCSVHGTDFRPYAKLLGPRSLNIPFVVLTDGDVYLNQKGEKISRGLRRIISVADAISHPQLSDLEDLFDRRRWKELRKVGKEIGVFVGHRTLEIDIFDNWHGPELVDALRELGLSSARTAIFREMADRENPLDEREADSLLSTISRFGKGRVAQRMANKVDPERFPEYVTNGILQIIEELAS